jgi:hypothetical protein
MNSSYTKQEKNDCEADRKEIRMREIAISRIENGLWKEDMLLLERLQVIGLIRSYLFTD